MISEIKHISDYKKVNLTGCTYKGLDLLNQLNLALYHLYTPLKKFVMHDPVMLHFSAGPFDPKEYNRNLLTYLKIVKNSTRKPTKSSEEVFLNMHIVTKEDISPDEIIIGFYNLEDNTFRRYLLKNVKKICKLLRITYNDFYKLFGRPSSKGLTDIYNYPKNKKIFQKKLISLIESADHIKINDIHINNMISFFEKEEDNLYYLNEESRWKKDRNKRLINS